MSDYKEHVYDESFNESILDFNIYCQESVGVAVAAIVGIGALITAIVLLIKKLFFNKENPSCLWASISRLRRKADMAKNGVLYSKKDLDLKAFSNGMVNIHNICELMGDLLTKVSDSQKDAANAIINKINQNVKEAEANFAKSYTDKDLSDNKMIEIRGDIKDLEDKAKDIAKTVKELSKENDKIKKNGNTTKTQQDYSKFYQTLTKLVSTATEKMRNIDKAMYVGTGGV